MYKDTPIGAIPEDWDVRPIAELLSLRNGVNADKSAYGQGIPFVNVLEPISHSHIGEQDIPGRVTLPPSLVTAYSVKRGDVLFNRTSEIEAELGLAGTYLGTEQVVFGGFVIRGRPVDQSLDPVYSGYAFRAPVIRSQIIPMGQGAVRANIGQGSLGRVLAPVPPLPEQRAIATALSDMDALLESLDHLIAKKRDLKQAAMQQLLTGQTRLPGFGGAWEVKKLTALADVDPENLTTWTDPDYIFSYISLEQVDSGRLLGASQETFRTAPSRARRVLRYDDVLMATVRPTLKAHLHFRGQVANGICSTGFAVLRSRPGIAAPGFVFAHLFGWPVNQQVERILAGSSYPAVSGVDIRRLEVPCPPSVEEQSAIAAVLSDMDAEIEALEARRAKTRDLKQAMMQELLTGRTRLV